MARQNKMPVVLRETAPTHADPAQQLLSLPVPEHRPQAMAAIPARRLWLCVHLPALPLEALNDAGLPAARAVFAEERGVREVLLASKAARAAGVSRWIRIAARWIAAGMEARSSSSRGVWPCLPLAPIPASASV